MSFKVKIGAKTLKASTDLLRVTIIAAHQEAVAAYQTHMIVWALQPGNVPYATGALQQSVIKTISESRVVGLGYVLYFGSDLTYAKELDQGTSGQGKSIKKPTTAFFNTILAWCITKGISPKAAWRIALHITQFGIDPQPWIDAGLQEARIAARNALQAAYRKRGIIASVNI